MPRRLLVLAVFFLGFSPSADAMTFTAGPADPSPLMPAQPAVVPFAVALDLGDRCTGPVEVTITADESDAFSTGEMPSGPATSNPTNPGAYSFEGFVEVTLDDDAQAGVLQNLELHAAASPCNLIAEATADATVPLLPAFHNEFAVLGGLSHAGFTIGEPETYPWPIASRANGPILVTLNVTPDERYRGEVRIPPPLRFQGGEARPDASQTFNVTFVPDRPGTFAMNLTFSSRPADGNESVPTYYYNDTIELRVYSGGVPGPGVSSVLIVVSCAALAWVRGRSRIPT